MGLKLKKSCFLYKFSKRILSLLTTLEQTRSLLFTSWSLLKSLREIKLTNHFAWPSFDQADQYCTNCTQIASCLNSIVHNTFFVFLCLSYLIPANLQIAQKVLSYDFENLHGVLSDQKNKIAPFTTILIPPPSRPL